MIKHHLLGPLYREDPPLFTQVSRAESQLPVPGEFDFFGALGAPLVKLSAAGLTSLPDNLLLLVIKYGALPGGSAM
jgi:hypothetical protein